MLTPRTTPPPTPRYATQKSAIKVRAKSYQSVNPCNGKTLKTFDELTAAQLERMLKTAATCFESWRQTTFAERAIIFAKAAKLMRERAESFAKLATLEMGKLVAEARGEVGLSADIIGYYARNAESFLAPQRLKLKPGTFLNKKLVRVSSIGAPA